MLAVEEEVIEDVVEVVEVDPEVGETFPEVEVMVEEAMWGQITEEDTEAVVVGDESYHNQYFKLVSDNNNILVGVGQVNYDPYYTYAGINLGFFT